MVWPIMLKVSCREKFVFRSVVWFLFLFVLTDAILLKLDLQKRTSVLDNPPNGKLFVYQKCIIYPKIGNVFLIFNLKLSQDSVCSSPSPESVFSLVVKNGLFLPYLERFFMDFSLGLSRDFKGALPRMKLRKFPRNSPPGNSP